jgi:dienelactone hydrolase
MGKIVNFAAFTGKLTAVVEAAKAKYPNVTSWGSIGFCWGGKIAVKISGANSPLKASAQVHPG